MISNIKKQLVYSHFGAYLDYSLKFNVKVKGG